MMVQKQQFFQLRKLVVCAGFLGLLGSAFGQSGQPVKIGLLATLEGPFAALGEDGIRGAELAIMERKGEIAGRKIMVTKGSSDATPDSAVKATSKLVEQDKVDIMIGPLSGDEGIAVKDYAKKHPGVTFINGASGAQATTLKDPSSNFFRFNSDGAQWMVGLGKAALEKGYKRVMVVAEDYGFPYSQVQGFMTEFCAAGGRVPVKQWVPLGTKDYSSVIAKIPKDIDAIMLVLGGADAVNFLSQFENAGLDKPMLGGSIFVDQTILNYKGKRRESLVGALSASPMADTYDGADWIKFVNAYKGAFPKGFPSPSLFAYLYYINTKAALDGLDAVKGDLSGGQAKYRDTLSKLVLKTPNGDVKLDKNRQAIASTFVTVVIKDAQGNLVNKVLKKTDSIQQLLGQKEADFQIGTRDVPSCP
ncbi:MAG: ABC transporter substrate-binding protein [Gammaproteobacteria bacterium]|nr:ABC transporter substrate-binding protein [Gammaproteobacteria bacterium]